jgi:hypothetical protein
MGQEQPVQPALSKSHDGLRALQHRHHRRDHPAQVTLPMISQPLSLPRMLNTPMVTLPIISKPLSTHDANTLQNIPSAVRGSIGPAFLWYGF